MLSTHSVDCAVHLLLSILRVNSALFLPFTVPIVPFSSVHRTNWALLRSIHRTKCALFRWHPALLKTWAEHWMIHIIMKRHPTYPHHIKASTHKTYKSHGCIKVTLLIHSTHSRKQHLRKHRPTRTSSWPFPYLGRWIKFSFSTFSNLVLLSVHLSSSCCQYPQVICIQ